MKLQYLFILGLLSCLSNCHKDCGCQKVSTPALPVPSSNNNVVTFPEIPKFQDYTTKVIPIKSALLQLNKKIKKDYRMKMEKMYAKGPNFAGYLTIANVGCGTSCSYNFVLDHRSGKLVDFFHTNTGISFKLNSNLLIANPPLYINQDCQYNLVGVITTVLVWDNNRLKIILKDNFYKRLCPIKKSYEEDFREACEDIIFDPILCPQIQAP